MRVSKQILLLLIMLSAALAAYAWRPSMRMADQGPRVNLESMIPKSFGEWHEDKYAANSIVNPEIKQQLAQLYSQTLSRVYQDNKGERIMLTIAYGADQTDSKALHYPEVCYPSQGFQIQSNKLDLVNTPFGNIRAKRMHALLGVRSEPVTYWTTVGNKVVLRGQETKIEQLRYGIKGYIPDGLLFRVSSISEDPNEGYQLQDKFVQDLLPNLTPNALIKLTGLTNLRS